MTIYTATVCIYNGDTLRILHDGVYKDFNHALAAIRSTLYNEDLKFNFTDELVLIDMDIYDHGRGEIGRYDREYNTYYVAKFNSHKI